MTTVTLDRRRRRSQATRVAIRRAALELVAERGLDAVSVEQIAERADVGYRTFFNHFGSKEEALVEPGEERAALVTEAFEARPASESPLEALRAALVAEATAIEGRKEELCLRLSVVADNPSLVSRFHGEFVVMERRIAEAVARRTGLDADRDVYPLLLAGVAITALRTSVLLWRAAGSGGNPGSRVTEAFDTLARGLTPPPAKRRR